MRWSHGRPVYAIDTYAQKDDSNIEIGCFLGYCKDNSLHTAKPVI